MAPPSTRPRLSNLDPVDVAADVCSSLVAHIARLAFPLAPAWIAADLPGDAQDLARSTDLGLTVQQLTVYAQSGSLGDWHDGVDAVDAVASVCSALYSQAGVPGTYDVGELSGDADPETPIGLVLVAVDARNALEHGRALTAAAGGRLDVQRS
jgi:hypothetical protein